MMQRLMAIFACGLAIAGCGDPSDRLTDEEATAAQSPGVPDETPEEAEAIAAPSELPEAEVAGHAWGRRPDGVWAAIPGSSWRAPAHLGPQTDEHPVVCVSWVDAAAFCKWLGERHEEAQMAVIDR